MDPFAFTSLRKFALVTGAPTKVFAARVSFARLLAVNFMKGQVRKVSGHLSCCNLGANPCDEFQPNEESKHQEDLLSQRVLGG